MVPLLAESTLSTFLHHSFHLILLLVTYSAVIRLGTLILLYGSATQRTSSH
ncbi:MAG: hypothetical protein ACKO6K_03220 [Chitinophagaceae bacterium]